MLEKFCASTAKWGGDGNETHMVGGKKIRKTKEGVKKPRISPRAVNLVVLASFQGRPEKVGPKPTLTQIK